MLSHGMPRPMRVIIYSEATCEALNLAQAAAELHALTGLQAELRGEFVAHWLATDAERGAVGTRLVEGYPDTVAAALVRARVADPMARFQPEREPLYAELSAERRALGKAGRTSRGILYGGAQVQWVLAELMGEEEAEALHVVVTGRLVGTWMPADGRWHAHTGVYGLPTLLSTTGLVQAPARPREYYQGQTMAAARVAPREFVEAALQQQLADRMLLLGDPRITPCVAGLLLQAIHFHLTGRAFCEEPACRLFNARRQEELLRSQCSDEAGLCPRHQAFFDDLRGNV